MNSKALKFCTFVVVTGLAVGNLKSNGVILSPVSDPEFGHFASLLVETKKMGRDNLFVTTARLQLHYIDAFLKKTKEGDSVKTNESRKLARGAIAHIATQTWPGWGPISKEAKELGRSAARLYLAYEIDAGEVSHWAYWINGAHALADKDYEEAESMFLKAEQIAEVELFKAMQATWVALTRFLADPNDETNERLDAGISRIHATGHASAKTFVSQVTTAKEIFETQGDSATEG